MPVHDNGSTTTDPTTDPLVVVAAEIGLLVESATLNAQVNAAIDRDFEPANAWELRFDHDGTVHWVSDEQVLEVQPAGSVLQRIKDRFFSHLPIEDEL